MNLSIYLLFILVILVCWIWTKFNLTHTIYCVKEIPGPNIWQNLVFLLEFIRKSEQDAYQFLFKLIRENGDIVKLWFGPLLVISIQKPEYLQAALNSEYCLGKPFFYDFLRMKNSLIMAPSE